MVQSYIDNISGVFHPFQQSNCLQTLDTAYATKYLLKEITILRKLKRTYFV